jgi:hypothetical protein
MVTALHKTYHLWLVYAGQRSDHSYLMNLVQMKTAAMQPCFAFELSVLAYAII